MGSAGKGSRVSQQGEHWRLHTNVSCCRLNHSLEQLDKSKNGGTSGIGKPTGEKNVV